MRRSVLGIICLVISLPTIIGAQDNRLWEVRPVVGMSVPVGSQRNLFKNAAFTGGEAALRILPTLDLLTSVMWQAADSKYRVSTTTASVWVFDIGVEVPVSYGYFLKSGNGASANDLSTHYRGIEAQALLTLRANLRLF